MKTNKKYTMIVTEVQLEFFTDKPWEGKLSDIVFGDNVEELRIGGDGHNKEGLYYMLYENKTGKRIGSGVVEWDSIQEEIQEAEGYKMYDVYFRPCASCVITVNAASEEDALKEADKQINNMSEEEIMNRLSSAYNYAGWEFINAEIV